MCARCAIMQVCKQLMDYCSPSYMVVTTLIMYTLILLCYTLNSLKLIPYIYYNIHTRAHIYQLTASHHSCDGYS